MEDRSIKILAIDDINDNLITLNALIKEVYPDATVITSTNGFDGYEIAIEEEPDVIILDVVMPGMDGFKLCQKLKSHLKLRDIPVVFLTALRDDRMSRIRALECGAEAFLAKPIDKSELTAQINAMLKIRKLNLQKSSEKERLALLVKEKTAELEIAHNKTLNLLDALKKENEIRKKSERALLEAQKLARIGSYSLNIVTGEFTCTNEVYNITGMEGVKLLDKDKVYEIVHPLDIDYFHRCNERAVQQKHSADYYCRIIKPDGQIRTVNIRFTPEYDADDKYIANNGTIQDITDRKKAENELRETRDYLEKLIGFANAPIAVWTNKGIITKFNRAFERLTGRKSAEVIGQNYLILFPKAQAPRVTQLLQDSQDYAGLVNEQVDIIHRDGSTRTIIWNSSTIYDESKSPISIIVQGQDITDRVKAEKELLHLSYHDQLTGLYNRRFFEEELPRLDIKSNLPLTIVMGDVNGLKLINDSLGHTQGDILLKEAANALTLACRENDIIARIGGDEFVLILPKTDSHSALQIVDRIKSILIFECKNSVDLSISFGYSTKTSEYDSILEVMADAENDMYRHKLSAKSSIRSQTIDMIMNTLFEKSNRESLHSMRVSKLCELIAVNMNLDKDEVNQIKIAGLLHDIGKIGVNEKILNKKNKLNDDEWNEIKKHPESGWRILSAVKEFSEVANYVLEHHERWDGRGYPKGLKEENISLQARIIVVADAYDAMTSLRSYQKGSSKEEAIKELKRCSGFQFDPKIVEVFIDKCVCSEG